VDLPHVNQEKLHLVPEAIINFFHVPHLGAVGGQV